MYRRVSASSLPDPIELRIPDQVFGANQAGIGIGRRRRGTVEPLGAKLINDNQIVFKILFGMVCAFLILLSPENVLSGIAEELGCPPKKDHLVTGTRSQEADGTRTLPEKGRPARPGESSCPVPLPGQWKKQEIWAWDRICKGENVDFNLRYRGKDWDNHYRRGWNGLKEPEKAAARLEWTNWNSNEKEERTIRADLLHLILFHEPWKSAIGKNGVKIYGAYIEEEINLNSADISHDLWLNYCVLKGGIKAGHIRAGRTISLEGSTVKRVEMGFGRIEGLVTFSKATVLDGINIEHTWINKTLYLEYCKYCKEPSNYGVEELKVIASSEEIDKAIKSNEIKLNLSGVSVKSFSCNAGYWPEDTKLDTFEYGMLCGDDGLAFWSPEDIVRLLGTQKVFSAQPYEQCARVLREAGQPTKANSVLFAGKERELKAARDAAFSVSIAKSDMDLWSKICERWDGFWRWIGLGLLRVTIGYGIGNGYFLSLGWVALFCLIGALVVRRANAILRCNLKFASWWACFAFSLDQLLPFVRLSRELEKYTPRSAGASVYFYFHKLVGWVLASFVVAGMAGLTK